LIRKVKCCKADFPGVYVPVSKFYNWIRKEIEKAGENPFNSRNGFEAIFL